MAKDKATQGIAITGKNVFEILNIAYKEIESKYPRKNTMLATLYRNTKTGLVEVKKLEVPNEMQRIVIQDMGPIGIGSNSQPLVTQPVIVKETIYQREGKSTFFIHDEN